jgi:hypothetical protein
MCIQLRRSMMMNDDAALPRSPFLLKLTLRRILSDNKHKHNWEMRYDTIHKQWSSTPSVLVERSQPTIRRCLAFAAPGWPAPATNEKWHMKSAMLTVCHELHGIDLLRWLESTVQLTLLSGWRTQVPKQLSSVHKSVIRAPESHYVRELWSIAR